MANRERQSRTAQGAGPRVSIGLPVYNGERFLEGTLDSILGQTYTDFELIISDNASTDGTQAICIDAARRDPRVRYLRSERNRGAMWNFHRVFHVSSGEYFKWSADDDQLEPEFLARCVAILDRDPTVVLCFSWFSVIDGTGALLPDRRRPLRFCASPPHERMRLFLESDHHNQTMFGLMRRAAVRRTRLFADYYGSDRHFLMELSLQGCFEILPEYLFIHREHPQRSEYVASPDAWWDPRTAGRRPLKHWRTLANIVRIVRAAPLTPAQRARCYAVLAGRAVQRIASWAPLLFRQLFAPPVRS